MKIAIIFFFAVLSEVIATSALKFSEGFTKLIPSVIVVLGYRDQRVGSSRSVAISGNPRAGCEVFEELIHNK